MCPASSVRVSPDATERLAGARQRWPAIRWPAAGLAEVLAAARPHLDACHVEDVFLARACAAHDAAALRVLEELLVELVPAILRVDSAGGFADEVLQQLRVMLVMGPEPRLLRYSGRGPLGAWLRALAVGTAIDLHRAWRFDAPLTGGEAELVSAGGPDLHALRGRYAQPFDDAVAQALRALPPQERTVLRLRFFDGLTFDEIAEFFDVHRTTVMRWLDKTQAAVRAQVRHGLRQSLGMTAAALDAVVCELLCEPRASLAAEL